jgi:hypothetical protein
MPRYIITIAPDNGAGMGNGTTNTTVRVDTSSGRAKVTELTIQGGSDGLAPADLPMVDLDLLLRALTSGQRIPRPSGAAAQAVPASKTGGRAAKGTGPAKGAGRKKAAAKRTRGAAKEEAARAAGGEEGRRPYRRMPAASEVLSAYQQAGTISGLAEHFGVPRHTANSWARRLRQQGHSIGRQ